jgi:biotin carboxylase
VLATSKLRQRARFEEAGVPQPDFEVCADAAEAAEAAERIGFPAVVKAPDRQGQRGLSLVRSPEELPGAVEAALAEGRSRALLVEELVPGREVTVNAFSADGRFVALTITDRLTAHPPAFGVALAHAWPSVEDAESCARVAGAATAALGIRNGPTYTQVRVMPSGPVVVELAARLGGGHDAELCDVALGVDLNALALAAALGEPTEMAPWRPGDGACVRFLVPPVGELAGVDGLGEARAIDGVVDVGVYRSPPWTFGPLRTGADRAGYVIARGDSRDDALARAARAGERVRFVTVDAAAPVQT